jgi:hypothetical protein
MVYFSKCYFSAEPVCTNHDVYSISFTFLPKFNGVLKVCTQQQKTCEKNLSFAKAIAFDPLNITFGPFDIKKGNQASLSLYYESERIFQIDTKVYDPVFFNNSLAPIPFTWTMYIASCFRIPSDFTSTPILLDAYKKFAEQYEKEPSDMIISLGDTVYIQQSQTGSRYGVLNRYIQLLNFPFFRNALSNSWWIACIDDHDLGINDTLTASYNIGMIRGVQQDVFPRVSYGSTNTVNSMYNVADITIIVLDDVSNRKYDIVNGNYISILGEEQLEWFCQALADVYVLFGTNAMILVVDGKSWFGSYGGYTYTSCPNELNRIIDTIDTLKLTNVIHMCGDSHFSDQSYYPLQNGGSITEFRNSSIGSIPRKNINDNPYRVPGSLVDVNNFGKVTIEGIQGKRSLLYQVFTKDGIVYEYSTSPSS